MLAQNSQNKAFTDRFLSHVKRFIETHSIFDTQEDLYVACSGGMDSMVLLHVLIQLKSFGYSSEVKCIHVNHGTRKSQINDEKLVKKFCHEHGIELDLYHLTSLTGEGNFEERARIARYKCFKKSLESSNKNPKLLLAHHIDDSFEWSLLQALRSSQLKSSLGIPVINGQKRRPLMCVTRKQIERYARYYNIPYINDPTNTDVKYERNFLRHQITTLFKKRHPQFLKHYVHRHNELANTLGLHCQKNISSFNVNKMSQCVHLYSLEATAETNGLREQMRDAIHHLSSAKRGQIQQQLDRALLALKNNQQGPITFSGGVQLVVSFNQLLFFKKGYEIDNTYYLNEHDLCASRLMHHFTSFTYEQFLKLVSEKLKKVSLNDFPLWVVIERKGAKWVSGQKRAYPLGTKLTAKLLQEGTLFISALNLVRQWQKSSNRKKSLRLTFLIPV